MPPRRDDPAESAAAGSSGDSYASIWSELSAAQRAAILAAIGSTEPPERSPAVSETIHALRRMRDDTQVDAPSSQAPSEDAPWAWHPRANSLLAANFDPALIIGGNAPPTRVLVCQQVIVPADAAIQAIMLDVVTAGAGLASGTAAVYEADGRRSGITHDQSAAWLATGVRRMPLVEQISARPDSRSAWVAFVADGSGVPGFAVPWISKAARPNLGLISPGPQRAGEIAEQAGCPDAIRPAEMVAGPQYWVGLV